MPLQPPYIHPQALVDSGVEVGSGTRIWAFAHLCSGAVIGAECNICDHTFVEGKVRLGDRVTVKCGVYLWDGVVVEDDVFIGPCVAFTNDLQPRSKHYPVRFAETILKQGCSLGANSTILPVTIGRWAMVAAGSVVTRDVPNYALVKGAPAKVCGWVCRCGEKLIFGITNLASCKCGLGFQIKNGWEVEETTNAHYGL